MLVWFRDALSRHALQEQLNVGIGTLAGSTIMLLTLPWAACVLLGRVDLSPERDAALYRQKPKLTKGLSQTETGVECTSTIPLVR